METKFRALAELCDKLEATLKRNLMVNLVADFLSLLRDGEVEPAVSMILGRAFPKSDTMTLDVNWATLIALIRRLTNLNSKSLTEAFSTTGDVGAATKIAFETSKLQKQATLFEKPLTILETRHVLEAIAKTRGVGSSERKERLLTTLLSKATPLEAKYLVKVIVGEMRTGFGEGLMELAVSTAFAVPHVEIQNASMILGDVAPVAAIAKTQGKKGISRLHFQVFRPIKPMLAQTANDLEEMFNEQNTEIALEHKLDGARVQIHKSGGMVRIFSRRLSDVSASFPEIVILTRAEVKGDMAILEGELIAIGNDGKPLPFQHLMRRFKRIHDVNEMVRSLPVELYLFDLVYLDGRSLINHPYIQRRKKLVEIAGGIPVIQQLITNSHVEARAFFNQALNSGHEGLMAKQLNSPYTPGIRGKHWLKIKKTLEPLDLVIVAAEYGYGRRRNWLSDYYLAAIDHETGEFMVVGKTFKGLTDTEIIDLTKKLKESSLTEERRRVVVKPQIVVEVLYNEIQASPKYPCGMALRFARINRIRYDKSPKEVDTIVRIRKIYQQQFEKKAKYARA